MSQKLPLGSIKTYNEDNDVGYFLEIDVQYLEHLHNLHNNLLSLLERIKMKKIEKIVANLLYIKEYVIYIRNLKQTFSHGVILKKVHRGSKFNQGAWLKPYIDMNTEPR